MSGANAFFIVVIVILLLSTTVFLFLWLTKTGILNTQKKRLTITNVKFKCNGTITATWDSVGDPKDLVTLYAATNNPIDFNADGTPSSPNNLVSPTVSGSAKTVSIPGAAQNTKYYVSLVVTNPDFVGFNVTSNVISTCGNALDGNFVMQEMNTPGAVEINISDPTRISYNTGVNKAGMNDIWMYDKTSGTISTRSTGTNSTAPRPTLYDNNGTLSAKPATPSPDANSQWTYNVDSPNSWCIKGTTRCMSLSSPITSGESIIIRDGSDTKFINIATSV